MAQAQSKRVYSLEGHTPMIVRAGRASRACARAKLAQAWRGPEAHRPTSHHGAYSARCMKPALHAITVYDTMAGGDPTKVAPTTCANYLVIGCVGPCVILMESNS